MPERNPHRQLSPTRSSPTAIIIGAGVVGLGVAWRLAQGGARVTVFDKSAAGSGASHAAAGMLAVCAEAEPGERDLVVLGRRSQALWPEFAAELEATTGLEIDLRAEGTLVVAMTAAERARVTHHLAYQQSLALPVEWISAADARRREPLLAPGLVGAVWSPQDHQVDNRKLVAALSIAASRAGVSVRGHCAVHRLLIKNDRAVGVALDDGSEINADVVVVAAGAWSRGVEGLPPALRPPVRPVKGQMIALQMDPQAPSITHVIRAHNVYMVPRRDGRLIIGATTEEKGFDATLTAGGVLALLEAAWRLVPSIEELPIAEMWVGHRPGTRDDAPILGPGPIDGLVYATGHHRNGILLAPVTASMIARLVLEGVPDSTIRPFGLERFTNVRAAE
ncbi:MAG: glycine oxidase ThiO [Bradyrhizobiaceae bacterium]|nr:glycine oxidase ThiO [Bradyrhizobiaceae bacterium]